MKNRNSQLKKQSAVVLFSGGQDSTTCLYWAKQTFNQVFALGFNYNQRHSLELTCAENIAKEANVPFAVLNLPLLSTLTRNSLTDFSLAVDTIKEPQVQSTQPHAKVDTQQLAVDSIKESQTQPTTADTKVDAQRLTADTIKEPVAQTTDQTPPNSMVDGRNQLFLTYAAIYAKSQNIHHLVTGVSEADYSGYPDCRKNFIVAQQKALQLSMDYPFVIHTPLMFLDKTHVWKLADELNILTLVKEKTLTCYNGIVGSGCGTCPACGLRNQGLIEYSALKH